jgi:hypothetical protein
MPDVILSNELDRLSEANRTIATAYTRISKLQAEADRLEHAGQDVSEIRATLESCETAVAGMVRQRERLAYTLFRMRSE